MVARIPLGKPFQDLWKLPPLTGYVQQKVRVVVADSISLASPPIQGESTVQGLTVLGKSGTKDEDVIEECQ